MPGYEFSKEQIQEVKEKFPKLQKVDYGWRGTLDIYAQYEGRILNDSFEVDIEIPNEYPSQIPLLREIGGKTQAIAKKHGKSDLKDLHFNLHNRTACLCVKQEEKRKFPAGAPITKFIDDLVVPYLYGLSFYDQEGHWPWREYSHGALGLLEFYATDIAEKSVEMIKDISGTFRADDNWEKYRDHLLRPRPKRLCVCGSGKKFSECHQEAWNGLLSLRADLHRLKLDTHQLFTGRRR